MPHVPPRQCTACQARTCPTPPHRAPQQLDSHRVRTKLHCPVRAPHKQARAGQASSQAPSCGPPLWFCGSYDTSCGLSRWMHARVSVSGYPEYCRILVRMRGVKVSLSTRESAASHCPTASRLLRRDLMRLPKSDSRGGGGRPHEAIAAQSDVNAAPAASRFSRSSASSPRNANAFSEPSCRAGPPRWSWGAIRSGSRRSNGLPGARTDTSDCANQMAEACRELAQAIHVAVRANASARVPVLAE